MLAFRARVGPHLPTPGSPPVPQRTEASRPAASWPGQVDDFWALAPRKTHGADALSPADRALLGEHRFLGPGNRGADVRELQRLLDAAESGLYDSATERAVAQYQRTNGLRPDGAAGQQTWAKLLGISSEVLPGTSYLSPDFRVTVESYRDRGRLNQMTLGTVAINGHTYRFRCGGHGRGSIPLGDYDVAPHLWERDTPAMVVDGVGWSFAVSDKYDDRVGDTRSLLRIHPDGGPEGTEGCIGIVGDGNVQRQFREDMRAAFEAYGERLTMRIGTTQTSGRHLRQVSKAGRLFEQTDGADRPESKRTGLAFAT